MMPIFSTPSNSNLKGLASIGFVVCLNWSTPNCWPFATVYLFLLLHRYIQKALIKCGIFGQLLHLQFLTALYEFLVAPLSVKFYIGPNLPVADRTELQRIPIILFNMVEPVHQTAIIHAMGDAEHVADFVDHCPEGGIQNELPIDLFGLLLCEGIIPSEKREYADSRLVLGPPIHEIPVFSWVDILQSDAHNTVGIFWHVALHILQDVLGEILFAIGVLSTSDVPKFRGEVEDRQAANSQSWVEYTAELYQLLQELVIELSELLEIDGLPLRGDFVVVRQSIVGKCLMHFLVMLQPISSLGLRHWLEQSLYLQEVSFVLLLLERTKSTCSLLLWYEHSQIIKRIINFNQSIICQRSSSMRHCRAIKGRISISSLRQTQSS